MGNFYYTDSIVKMTMSGWVWVPLEQQMIPWRDWEPVTA